MADYSENVRQLIEKLLIHRGKRNANCRVFAPTPGSRSYSVILEESHVREQFYVDSAHVDQFVRTGNNQHILPDIRTGFRTLDRLVLKKAARGH